MKHALMQMQYRFAVIYETLSIKRNILIPEIRIYYLIYSVGYPERYYQAGRMPDNIRKAGYPGHPYGNTG